MYTMFSGCNSLQNIKVSDNFVTTNVSISYNMFYGCTSLIGGNGTTFNSNYTDKTYARIDTNGSPGYFTRGD